MKIGVLGGGAAGFFGAIHAAEANKTNEVTLLERSNKLLSKVRISGGGRCNVTHACFDDMLLVKSYPRGERELRGPFSQFSTRDTIAWFKSQGVTLKTEPDGRMFPTTDSSETIVHCLNNAAWKAGVKIVAGFLDMKLRRAGDGFEVILKSGEILYFDKILVATGGAPKLEAFDWLTELGHTIIPPVPSLFTFNLLNHPLIELAGVSVEEAIVSIQGKKLKQSGPLLVTHWGLSGPAVLRLSAWGARVLSDVDYNFMVEISWVSGYDDESMKARLIEIKLEFAKKNTCTFSPFGLPSRLWKWLLQRAGIPEDIRWADLSKTHLSAMRDILIHCTLEVKGKSTFKEEFVTAGGVKLKDVNLKTMESRKCPNLYFAGEVLDIDGITGGFNFQAAWTTGYIAGKSMGTPGIL